MPNDIEIKSEEVQEVLSRPPKRIIRYGIAVVFAVIAGLFVGSYFFKYPDIITASISITTENLPANLVAKTSGRIDELFVVEKQSVKQGDIIAVIENTANFNDVMQVKSILETDVETRYPLPQQSVSLQLGIIQNSYHSYQKSINDYQIFIQTDYFNKKIAIAKQQLQAQKSLVATLQKQLPLERHSFESAQKLFKMDSALFARQALTLSDFENAKQNFIRAQQNLENAEINIENQKVAVLQLEENIIDLEKQYSDNVNQLETGLNGNLEALQNDIKNWEQMFLFVAPIDGDITFTKFWQKNQNITTGETLATIVPSVESLQTTPQQTKIIGKIMLSPIGAGKVKIGQSVNVKFDNFPYMEYGMVKTQIMDISLVPISENNQQFYVLEVLFTAVTSANGVMCLQTNYNKTIPFSQQMSGTAEIITDDLRLIDRFIKPIKAVVKR